MIPLVPAIALVAFVQNVDRDLRLEFDDVSAKAAALIETVNAMEQRAKEIGESLHPDLLGQRNLVQSSLARAEEALRDRNNTELRERLTRARGHVERLAKML